MAVMAREVTLLVVDDEPDVLESILDLLGCHLPGVDLHGARDAAQALALLQRQAFGLVVSDHRMPGMTGLDLLSECRRRWPTTPRILVTAYPEEGLARRALQQADIHAFLPKPIAPGLLLDTVNAALVKARAPLRAI